MHTMTFDEEGRTSPSSAVSSTGLPLRAKKSLVRASRTSTQKQRSPRQMGMSMLMILYLFGLWICSGGSSTSRKSDRALYLNGRKEIRIVLYPNPLEHKIQGWAQMVATTFQTG